jgi:hypothetical protein
MKFHIYCQKSLSYWNNWFLLLFAYKIIGKCCILVSKGKEVGRVLKCTTMFEYIIRSWKGWSRKGKMW